MLTLYMKPTCPFCKKVIALVEDMKLEVEMKDITASEAVRDELIEKGGKKQVPYLVDTDKEVSMYESDEIMDFLELNYGPEEGSADTPRVHVGGETCVACEG